MAIVKTDDHYYNAIANAIRSRNGGSLKYKPSDLASAIYSIFEDGVNLSTILINAPAGTVTTAICGDESKSITVDSSGNVTMPDCGPGEWSLSMTYNGLTISKTVTIDSNNQCATYYVSAANTDFGHKLTVYAPNGAALSINGTSYGFLYYSDTYTLIYPMNAGTYNITASGYGSSKSGTVTIPSTVLTPTEYTIDLTYTIPSTVTLKIYLVDTISVSAVYAMWLVSGVYQKFYATKVTSNKSGYTQWNITNVSRPLGSSLTFATETNVTYNGGGGTLYRGYEEVLMDFYSRSNEIEYILTPYTGV